MKAEESYCECICASLRVEWETDRGWEVFGKSSFFLAIVWESGWLLDAVFPTPGTPALDKTHLICFSWASWLFWSLFWLVLCLADPPMCWVSDNVEAGHIPYLSLSSSFGSSWEAELGELTPSWICSAKWIIPNIHGKTLLDMLQKVYQVEMRTKAMPGRELLPGSNNLMRSVPGASWFQLLTTVK